MIFTSEIMIAFRIKATIIYQLVEKFLRLESLQLSAFFLWIACSSFKNVPIELMSKFIDLQYKTNLQYKASQKSSASNSKLQSKPFGESQQLKTYVSLPFAESYYSLEMEEFSKMRNQSRMTLKSQQFPILV